MRKHLERSCQCRENSTCKCPEAGRAGTSPTGEGWPVWLEQTEGGGGGAGEEVRRAIRSLRMAGLSAMARNLGFIPKYTEELLEGFR